ncbi:hypothetical protein BGZ75_006484 [Mortierella antarctica]|nr:hypothetical protein BGZ75_006484 [Mortierella antarctica]
MLRLSVTKTWSWHKNSPRTLKMNSSAWRELREVAPNARCTTLYATVASPVSRTSCVWGISEMSQKDINLKTLQLFSKTYTAPLYSDVDRSAVVIADRTVDYANVLLRLEDDFDYSAKCNFSMSYAVKKRSHSELESPAATNWWSPSPKSSSDSRLPTELWKVVCSYLYPSQLARLSRVNRTLNRLVSNMRIWSAYFVQLRGRRSFPFFEHLRNKPNHHMHYIIALSYHICDHCTILSHPDSPQKFAAMPLSVLEWPQPKQDQADYYPRPGNVHLCLPCRREHYEVYPEPIPVEVLGRYLPKFPLKNKYFIGEMNIKSIKDRRSYRSEEPGGPTMAYEDPNGSYYSERAVLMNARRVYGGDVGIQAYRDDPFYISELSEEKQRIFEAQFKSFASAKRTRIN